jgi:hypothetical protein
LNAPVFVAPVDRIDRSRMSEATFVRITSANTTAYAWPSQETRPALATRIRIVTAAVTSIARIGVPYRG